MKKQSNILALLLVFATTINILAGDTPTGNITGDTPIGNITSPDTTTTVVNAIVNVLTQIVNVVP